MRQWLVKVIPVSLKIAAACGIGLFISEIGLSYSAGIGAITGAVATPLEIAGCPEAYKDDNGFCTSHKMTNPTVSFVSTWFTTGLTSTMTDVDRYILRRCFHGIPDVLQDQKCYDGWNRLRHHNFMAVRSLHDHRRKPATMNHANLHQGVAHPLLTSQITNWVTIDGRFSRKSSISTLSVR